MRGILLGRFWQRFKRRLKVKLRSEKSSSSSKQTAKKAKTKRSPNVLNDDQMEELTSWIFSTQEASDVEGSIREKLLEL